MEPNGSKLIIDGTSIISSFGVGLVIGLFTEIVKRDTPQTETKKDRTGKLLEIAGAIVIVLGFYIQSSDLVYLGAGVLGVGLPLDAMNSAYRRMRNGRWRPISFIRRKSKNVRGRHADDPVKRYR